jgi:hypothetical protein
VENLFSILTSVAVVSISMEVLLKQKKIVLMKTNLISVLLNRFLLSTICYFVESVLCTIIPRFSNCLLEKLAWHDK